jgi:uncharacterized protein (TIGR03067 family)
MSRVLPLLAVLCLVFAPAPFPKRVSRATIETLAGSWDEISTTGEGKAEINTGRYVVFSGGRLTVFNANGAALVKWSIAINGSTTPAQFKLILLNTPPRAVLGICDLRGSTLRMCFAYEPDPMPTRFDASRKGAWLMVLKRKGP